jgi:hypothetical protein
LAFEGDTVVSVLPTSILPSFHHPPHPVLVFVHLRICIMSAFKEADVQLHPSESQDDAVYSEKKGTPDDQKDMHRMGKTQELRRNFRFVSIFGYSMILMATWETVLTLVVT